ncbi:hypothetical protein ABZ749_01200 [Micromonospora sp. NPDC047753]|uniref:hypothetical protein n=1 Tax=Micromonospora sp. NPDC047753 TaxID=3154817 RepID=UPI0033EB9260
MNRRLFLAALAHLTRAAVYSALAVGLLLAATVTRPASPLELRWRPATAAEERAYERQRLHGALDEYHRQHP